MNKNRELKEKGIDLSVTKLFNKVSSTRKLTLY